MSSSSSARVRAFLRDFIPPLIASILNIPRSLSRVLFFQDPPHPDPQRPLPPDSLSRLSTHSVTSLTSSRPAPPSPAVSRRASGLSRASSRPPSGASSRPTSGVQHSRPPSGITMSASAPSRHTPSNIAPPTPDASTPTPTSTTAFIHIRDFGFAQADPRFTGQGPNVPRPNRPTVLARRLASTTTSSSTSSQGNDDDEWEDEEDGDGEQISVDVVQRMWQDVVDDGTHGWGGFKWGFGRAWGYGSSNGPPGASFPTRGDLDRNFGTEDDDDMEVDEPFSDEEGQSAESEPPLCPGLYRALYAFEPEGTAEMKLEEDQVVRVIGRGGGVGWAVVVKDGLKDTGVHALVPESYLELVRLDGVEEDPEC